MFVILCTCHSLLLVFKVLQFKEEGVYFDLYFRSFSPWCTILNKLQQDGSFWVEERWSCFATKSQKAERGAWRIINPSGCNCLTSGQATLPNSNSGLSPHESAPNMAICFSNHPHILEDVMVWVYISPKSHSILDGSLSEAAKSRVCHWLLVQHRD